MPETEAEALRAIASFHLVTPDLPRLANYYHQVLGFVPSSPIQPIGGAEMALLGIAGGAIRQVFSIGHQRVVIEQFDVAGRPYPANSNAASLWFQHLALVVSDIAAAYSRLRDSVPISRFGPRQLPPSAGGVEAFKFRDPDGHPLELLAFPAGQSPAAWQPRTTMPGQIVLGIDHTAISVRDMAASVGFYRRLGLARAPGSLNQGPSQQDLDNLPNVRVAVAPMQPQAGTPHLELLEYEVPRGDIAAVLQPNDVAATRVAWRGAVPSLFADPDGHLHQVVL